MAFFALRLGFLLVLGFSCTQASICLLGLPHIQIPHLKVQTGTDFIIPIIVFEGGQISSLQFDLAVDSRIGEGQLTQPIRGDLLQDHSLANETIPGGIRVLITSASSQPFGKDLGTVLQMRRSISGSLPQGTRLPVGISNAVAVDNLGNRIDLESFPGEVEIGPGGTEPPKGANDLFFPQIADGSFPGGRFRTLLIFANLAEISTEAEVLFSKSDGSPFVLRLEDGRISSRFDFSIEPSGSVFLATTSSGPLGVGYAEVRATAPIGGTLLFASQDETGKILTEAGVGSSVPLRAFTVPVVYDRGQSNTGIALVNTNDSAVLLTLSLRDSENDHLAWNDIVLEAGCHLPRFASELFPSLSQNSEFRGFIRVSASRPVSAVALKQRGSLLTTFPVVEE